MFVFGVIGFLVGARTTPRAASGVCGEKIQTFPLLGAEIVLKPFLLARQTRAPCARQIEEKEALKRFAHT
jgi:hypothetical protein